MSPGTFIAYAEEQGLILPMTDQLLERILADLPVLAPHQWVSVNLVAGHIEQPRLRTQLQRHGWPSPARLTFELTERDPIKHIQGAMAEIAALQERAITSSWMTSAPAMAALLTCNGSAFARSRSTRCSWIP